MSGLLERIARRRRTPASGWLGKPQENGAAHVNGASTAQQPGVNGVAPAPAVLHALQAAGTDTAAPEAPAHAPGPEAPSRGVAPEPPAPPPHSEHDDQPTTVISAEELARGELEHAEPGFKERGRLRRRVRYLRQLREVQLRDIGGFMVELHRFGRMRPDLVEAKVQGASQVDLELKSLERALGEERTLRELREAGIGGACEQCGSVHGSEDNFCATCGAPLSTGSKASGDH